MIPKIIYGHLMTGILALPMATNCAPLLTDLCLYSYETDFIQGLLKKKRKEASPIL